MEQLDTYFLIYLIFLLNIIIFPSIHLFLIFVVPSVPLFQWIKKSLIAQGFLGFLLVEQESAKSGTTFFLVPLDTGTSFFLVPVLFHFFGIKKGSFYGSKRFFAFYLTL